MLNVVFRMYIQEDYVAGNLTIGLAGLYVNSGEYFRFLIFLFIIISVQGTCAMTHMEARDQESGLSIHHWLRRLNSGCQACSGSTCNHWAI